MRRLLQAVAVAVAGLLVVQPALAAFACTTPSHCAMSVSEMGPECLMARSLAAGDCSSDCCEHKLPVASQNWTTLAKPRTQGVHYISIAAAPDTESAFATPRPEPLPLSSPPLYVLHRVFRI